MVDTKVKVGERRGKQGVIGPLKEYRQENSQKGGAMAMLCDTRGHTRFLERDLRVQEGGIVMPGSIGWPRQIYGLNFQSAGIWHRRAQ